MGFEDWSNNKKKKKSSSFEEWSNANHGISKAQEEEDERKRQAYLSRNKSDDDIAPVGGNKDSWFKSGGFSDGVDGVGDFFGDLGQTIGGTVGDLGLGIVKGAGRMVEGLVDLGTYGVAGVADAFGADDFADKAKKVAQYSAVDEWTKPATDFVDRYSVLGNKADMVSEGLGQVGAIILTGGAAAAGGVGAGGVAALTTGLTGLSGMGSGMNAAYKEGASDEDAFKYGLGVGAIEAGTELLFGGLGKGVKALGISRGIGGLDDIFAKKLSSAVTRAITNEAVQKIAGNTIEAAIKAGGEGAEEVLSGLGSAVMKKLTYEDDESIGKLIEDENLLEQFVVGAITSSIAQGADFVKANKSGRDFVTGYTNNEQAVIDKEVERRVAEREKAGKKLTTKEISAIEEQVQSDMEHGQLDIETIEEVLGGESYTAYKDTIKSEDSLKAEYEQLANIKKSDLTTKQEKRLAELEAMNLDDTSRRDGLRKKLDETVFPQLKDSKLAETYKEGERKGQAFEADLSKYTGKQRAAVERAVKSGVLNNTYRSHELVDVLSKIEAARGISFDYTNNAKLKESGFAVDGKTVNGYANKKTGSVTLNVQSSKAWQSVVGHEITHVLEGTEAYGALQNALYAYANSKGELDSRRTSLSALYQNMDADIDAELTADLVGDYLFTDKDFVNHLTGNRTLFQKVYDEIKYLWSVATGKEKSEIEKVKAEFDRAWKEYSADTKNDSEAKEYSDDEVKYSLREEAPPKETGIAYKVFFVKDGKLYPPMVANPDGADTPMGVWLNADVGTAAPPSKTGRAQVKAGGKGTQGGSGSLAFRPGWHLGDLPRASQFDRVNPETGKKELFPENFVWAEVEYAKDVDYQEEAMSYGYTESGKFRHAYAGLPRLPENGYYRYRTNPKPDTVPWVITGAMKVNRLLSDAEVNEILEKNGVPAVHRQGGDVGLEKFGFDEGGKVQYSISEESDADYMTAVENGDTETAQAMVDEAAKNAGYSIKAYHGTGYDFTVFDKSKQGDNYKDWGRLGKGFYFAPTAREAETWAELSRGGKNKVMPVYLKSENMLDSFEALPDNLKDTIPADWDSLTRRLAEKYAYNYIEYMQEFGHDVQAILKEKGYDGINGHVEYVLYDPEQIKSADPITYDDKGNVIPLSDRFNTAHEDIRFSLSKSVEETKDLMALHNLQSSELAKTLELGGLPMPSIAVIKDTMSHEEYGDVSLILPKEAIDPAANKDNKVYGGDAWTPTYPKIEYKPNEKVAKKIRDKYYGLANVIGYDEVRPLYNYVNDIENTLNRAGGEVSMLEKLYEDTGMMNVYLQDSGNGKVEPVVKETVTKISDAEAEMNQFFIDAVGKDFVTSFKTPDGENPLKYRSAFVDQHDAKIRDAYARYFKEVHGFSEEQANNVLAATNKSELMKHMLRAYKFTQDNGVTVKTETDYEATEKAIREAASDGYKEWVDGLFRGIEGKSGIRNNQDYYTRSGNPRSWDALHWENTLENVIKVMKGQGETGVDSFSPFNTLFGSSHKRYGSIQEIKADSGRLGMINQDEYDAMKDSFSERFAALASSIKDPDERNPFIATDTAAEQIIEAVRSKKTKTGILNHLKALNSRANMQTVEEVLSLVSDIANMPTGYFEAKPQRAVGLEEVGVFVIPRNSDVKLKQELLNRGYSIAEYDPDVDGDRQRVVNGFEEYKFSLSNVGEEYTPVGNYSTPLKDLALQKDIAPVATNTPTAQTNTPTAKANTPTAQSGELFPEGYAPVTEEEADALSKARYETITDADAPPEMPAPYYGESIEPVDPFESRDMKEVGSQKVKAYMYENPEVKPFFQQEAEVMLGDLYRTTRGERVVDAQVLYDTNGEAGVWGVKRQTAPDIAELKDRWGYTYDEIEAGIKAIIEDNGKENNACSKRIEFMLNDRLMNGYQDFIDGFEIPANQEYRNLINEKGITEYDEEARKHFFDDIESYIPPVEEDIAPTAETEPEVPIPDEIAPMTEEEANAIQDEKAKADKAAEGEPKSRKQLHKNILDDVKATFSSSGYDFDDVLANAKNLSTFDTVDNTPQRVMEKALGYKEGGVLADLTVNRVAQNETAGISWLNGFTDRKNGLLAKISKQYRIKPGSKESAAAQMYAEGFYVNDNNDIVAYGDAELAQDFPDVDTQCRIKGLAHDPRIRQIYDETLAAINDSRVRNAYPEIQKLDNYFLHFRAMDDTFSRLGLPFNPNDIRAKDLPTDLNGVTADLKPGQPYFASAMHRTGKRTSFDLLGGLERYLTSAKNQIYHIDDIQTLRALRNYIADTYGQANGLEGIDVLSEEEAQEKIEMVYNSHLSTFAKFLNEEANVLAGKTALIDRGLEGVIGRRGMTFLDTLNKQVGSNMVGFNISSSLTNFLPVAQAFAKTNKFDFTKAFAQTVSNKIGSIFGNGDGFAESSPVIIRRKGADRFYRTPWQKAGDAGYVLMSAVDDISTELIARTKFNELTRKGMDEQAAHIETDKWVSRLMGDRSLGQQPQLYNSKTLGVLTKFQLEVRNQLDSQFYDTIQEAKVSSEDIENGLARNAKIAAKVTTTFVQLAVVQHLYGKAFESVAGYNPAFDIISTLATMFGWDDEEESEDTVLDNIEQGFLELLEDLPYTSTFTGGRIPIANALPITELIKGVDQYGNEKSRLETLGEAAPYYILPGGYGQYKKTKAGLNMFSDEHPISGSYTDKGNLRFPVEDTPANRVQAAVFGQYASENAREYFDNEYAPLKEKQIQEYIDVDIPIKDYWKYRQGLAKQDKLEDKLDYISGLDLPVSKKNILANNVTDRKEPLDLTNYDDFASLEEFDFATKQPEKYAFAKTVGGYSSYKEYSGALNDIKADKDASGKSISGSRKEKVIQYINNLDADYATKIILLKSEYPSDDSYNTEIIEYLNGRSDLTYEERVSVLTELGFRVTADGQIYAD